MPVRVPRIRHGTTSRAFPIPPTGFKFLSFRIEASRLSSQEVSPSIFAVAYISFLSILCYILDTNLKSSSTRTQTPVGPKRLPDTVIAKPI
jgi:hypothetical protein